MYSLNHFTKNELSLENWMKSFYAIANELYLFKLTLSSLLRSLWGNMYSLNHFTYAIANE
ncbi:hypothetical protein ACJX0J_015753, partial [Zea mays]